MLRLIKLFLLLYISIIVTANAQHIDLKGQITDRQGTGIPGATVMIKGLEAGAVSDSLGFFSLPISASDVLTVEVRSVGFKPFQFEVNHPFSDFKKIVLEEAILGLDHVVVTGTMQPTFLSKSPVKTEVITGEHFNTFLPGAASGIMEGINLINGIQEVVACGVCFTNSISINGLPGPYTAVLLDGTPMYGNLASVYGLNGIPSMIIDRIEVIKGPNSTLYGSEAMAGVINIITKDPAKEPLLSTDIMLTSHFESFGNIAFAPSIGNSSGYIGLNFAYMNNYEDDNDDGFNDMINMDRVSVFTKWDINRKSGKQWFIAGRYFFEDRRNGVRQYLRNRNYKSIRGSDSIYGESILTNRVELYGRYKLNVPADLVLDYSFSTHHQNSYYGTDFYLAEQLIGFSNLIYTKNINRHNLTSGLTLRYQYYDDNTVATRNSIGNQPSRQFIPGVFIQDELELNKITLLGGMRFDYYKFHGIISSPRLSIKANPGKYTTLRLNSGTGFRIVNLFTEDHAFITGQRTVEIWESLRPERSYNLSFNANHNYTLSNSQGVIDFDIFYTHFINKIIPDYDEPEKIIYANSEGFAQVRGAGLNLTHEFLFPLSLTAGVTIQKSEEVSDNERNKILFAPDWSGVINGRYEFKDSQVTLAYSANFTGPMSLPRIYDLDHEGRQLPTSRPTRSDPFAIHNLQVTKKFNETISIYGGVQNFFNYKQAYSPLSGYNDPYFNPGFSDKFDTSYAFSSIHGREFYIGFLWSLSRE